MYACANRQLLKLGNCFTHHIGLPGALLSPWQWHQPPLGSTFWRLLRVSLATFALLASLPLLATSVPYPCTRCTLSLWPLHSTTALPYLLLVSPVAACPSSSSFPQGSKARH
ncbi:hypothetical protein K437DRAFT_125775 [Tilletiaria anomala UBC 951]|uniref:Uncharacterized protein n=1 Tax=Tilletiaria anomala (strain ATCC 24038 / CBS 436.72 / UBC 951) TaxID=1037660 RepID=A0A066W2Q7_TILAU|nr:uncharacterized protein K437DRAFT_125775 [Tilletiaria anomala UBC 951]KDN45080.1 hypothetical protein K437DRAFT_125775 [Tilletiaria anomala UBC 951]